MNSDETSTQATQYDEVIVHCQKKDKALYIKYFLSDRERKELIKSCGDAACMLYEYYLRMASLTKPEPDNFSDIASAEYFGWDKQKVKRNRLKLTKAKWFDVANFKYYGGRRGVSFYVGPESVPS